MRLEDACSPAAIAATRAACLILHGGADTVLPLRHAWALVAAAGAHAQLIVIDGEGHDSIFRDRSGRISRDARLVSTLAPSARTGLLSDLH